VREKLLNIATVVVTVCVIILTATTIHRQYFTAPVTPELGRHAPVFLDDWRSLTSVGHREGYDDADVTVITFSDFECPMCAAFATQTYPTFAARYPGTTALVYRHWPLAQHRFAFPAARASECAAEQGRFKQFHDALYAQQDIS
jgi:hypothetical protein